MRKATSQLANKNKGVLQNGRFGASNVTNASAYLFVYLNTTLNTTWTPKADTLIDWIYQFREMQLNAANVSEKYKNQIGSHKTAHTL